MKQPKIRFLSFLILLTTVTSLQASYRGDFLIDSRSLRQNIARHETVYEILKSEADTGIVQEKGKITKNWLLAKKFELAGDEEKAGESYKSLQETQYDLSYRNLETVSLALLREGLEALAEGDKVKAVNKADLAAGLSPEFPIVRRTQAWISIRSGSTLRSIRQGLASLKLAMTHFWTFVPFLINLFSKLAFTLLFMVVGTVIVFAVKRIPQLIHEVARLFPGGWPGKLIGLGVWLALVTIPLSLRVGLLWVTILMAGIIYPYSTKREQKILRWEMGFIVILPFILYSLAIPYSATADRGFQAMLKIRYGAFTRSDLGYLEQLADSQPQNPWPRFALGLAYKKRGEYQEAEEIYRRLLARPSPPAVEARVAGNLGNVFYAQNRLDEALEQYKKGVSLKDKLASIHYNLSRIYSERLFLEEGDREYSKARKIDRDLIHLYTTIYTPHPNRVVIDEPIPFTAIWRTILGFANRQTWLVGADMTATFLPGLILSWIPSLGWFQGLLPALLFTVVVMIRNRFPRFDRCYKCGRVFSSARKGEPDSILCFQCRSVFLEREGIDSQFRLNKMVEVRRHKRVQKRLVDILSLIIPGGGHLYLGRQAWKGVVGLFLFLFGLMAALEVGKLTPILFLPAFLAPSPLLPLIFITLVYAALQISLRKES